MIRRMVELAVLIGILSKTSCGWYRFILIDGPKTWQESQTYCRKNHMDLATVQGDEDRARLREAADKANFTSFAWIGFYNGVPTWRWSYQNKEISFASWESWEPNMSRTSEACAFVQANQRWADTTCLEEKCFFCQTDKGKLEDKFKFIDVSMKWREAQLHCRTHYRDLATVADGTENAALANIISSSTGGAWIGLSKNLWLWSDQTNVSWPLISWQEGQPDNVDGHEECGCAGTEGQIADDSCSTKRSFYCKTSDVPPLRRLQMVRVTVRSSGSLKEPAVMEALEKQMMRMLSEKKMDKGSNVTSRIHPDGKIFHQHGNATYETTNACEEINPIS